VVLDGTNHSLPYSVLMLSQNDTAVWRAGQTNSVGTMRLLWLAGQTDSAVTMRLYSG
jgi:hypothetical protein